MKKKYSLKNRKAIQNVFRIGKYVRREFLSCKYLKNQKNDSRFVISISKKYSKKAVLRNRLKRHIRSAVVEDGDLLQLNADCAFYVSSPCPLGAFPYDQVLKQVRSFSDKLKDENSVRSDS